MTRGCSFTGHRQIPENQKKALGNLLDRGIAYAYDAGCRDFFCGGAVGFDTLAAKEVIRFRLAHPDVRLILLLPCPDQAENWPAEQRSVYEFTLQNANEVRYSALSYTSTCMKERNAALADACDILLAYVNHDRSGASQTVRMAKEKGRTVYNLATGLCEPSL